MSTPAIDQSLPVAVDEIDYSKIEISDDTPVDGLIQHHEMELLTNALYASWRNADGEKPKFVAFSDVGVFYQPDKPPIVPDVLVSLGVEIPKIIEGKKDLSYFIWRYGKPPEVTVEIVSNTKGNELESKRLLYAQIGVAYYVVFDPEHYLSETTLHLFERHGSSFARMSDHWLRDVGLGLTLWTGEFRGMTREWLRWCDEAGDIFLTGQELAEAEAIRADQEAQRAAKLAAKLRELGVDPDSI